MVIALRINIFIIFVILHVTLQMFTSNNESYTVSKALNVEKRLTTAENAIVREAKVHHGQ
jgi:hypothetical protein